MGRSKKGAHFIPVSVETLYGDQYIIVYMTWKMCWVLKTLFQGKDIPEKQWRVKTKTAESRYNQRKSKVCVDRLISRSVGGSRSVLTRPRPGGIPARKTEMAH